MRKMFVALGTLLALLLAALAGALAWQWSPLRERSAPLERLVAVSWGDGKFGKSVYGAYVFYEPQADGRLAVKLSVRIGRAEPMNSYEHEPRLLGTARNAEDAVARLSAIAWSDKGLAVGSGANAHLFAREQLESHR